MRSLIPALILLAGSALALCTQADDYLGNLSANPFAPNSTANPQGGGSRYDANSINNPYGRYGSQYSPESINNPFGAGSPYAVDSPNNPFGSGLRIIGDD